MTEAIQISRTCQRLRIGLALGPKPYAVLRWRRGACEVVLGQGGLRSGCNPMSYRLQPYVIQAATLGVACEVVLGQGKAGLALILTLTLTLTLTLIPTLAPGLALTLTLTLTLTLLTLTLTLCHPRRRRRQHAGPGGARRAARHPARRALVAAEQRGEVESHAVRHAAQATRAATPVISARRQRHSASCNVRNRTAPSAARRACG